MAASRKPIIQSLIKTSRQRTCVHVFLQCLLVLISGDFSLLFERSFTGNVVDLGLRKQQATTSVGFSENAAQTTEKQTKSVRSFTVSNQKLSAFTVYVSALIASDWSWHLECSCTIGWATKGGRPSGGSDLDVVGGVEAHLAAAQLSFTPALLVLLPHPQQLLAWRKDNGQTC